MDMWRAVWLQSVYHDVYDERLHSRRLCKEPPSTQAQHVLDNEPNCG